MCIRRTSTAQIAILSVCLLFILASQAKAEPALSNGATVYVPIYSNIYTGPKAITYNLAAMLSIRNTDAKFAISLTRADYYDSEGKLVKRYLENPIVIQPLASKYFYIKEYDDTGGSGANFIVEWRSKGRVNKPIIEGILTGLRSGQGVSFRCPGQEIIEHSE